MFTVHAIPIRSTDQVQLLFLFHGVIIYTICIFIFFVFVKEWILYAKIDLCSILSIFSLSLSLSVSLFVTLLDYLRDVLNAK